MFKRIDHVEIVTDQPDRRVEFFTGVPMDLVYLDLGGTVVELISYEGATVEPEPKNEHLGYRMMALEVDDMNKTTEYLKAKGINIVWGPKFREKYARAEIADPNGFHIELRQWL